MLLFTEMAKTQGEAFVGAGEMISILEGLNSRSLLGMQVELFSGYLWKGEGTEDKNAKNEERCQGSVGPQRPGGESFLQSLDY